MSKSSTFIILFLALLSTIICSIEECIDENDETKCSSHEITEFDGVECVKKTENNNDVYCDYFPTSKEVQKSWINFVQTMQKEVASMYPDDDDFTNEEDYPEYSYEIGGETIKEDKYKITEDDLKIINSGNTCGFLFAGQQINLPERLTNYTKKEGCYNTKQFEGLKNILNCGYATIDAKFEDKNSI